MIMFLLLVMVMIEMISSHLLFTTTLTRHGTRAPNPVVIDVCPGLYKTTTEIVDAYVNIFSLQHSLNAKPNVINHIYQLNSSNLFSSNTQIRSGTRSFDTERNRIDA